MRTKADIIRHTRKTAAGMKSRSAVYRRMENWKEEFVGLPEEKHTITLKDTWSFEPETILIEKDFGSVAEAMRGISMTYPCKEILERDSDRQELIKVRSVVRRLERALELKNKEVDVVQEEVDIVQKELDGYAINLSISDMCLEWANCELERKTLVEEMLTLREADLAVSDSSLEWANCKLEIETKYSGVKKLIRSFGKGHTKEQT